MNDTVGQEVVQEFVQELTRALRPGSVVTDRAEVVEHGRDWTKVFTPDPLLLVRPASIAEVQTTLRLANDACIAVVPSGGRTGLAGGAVARQREIVLSLSRLSKLGPVDVLGRTVRVEAGAVTQAVHEHAAEHGLTWPVDFASKGSSQVGGNISTNAGGIKVIRYGLTRQWVLGLEVVLANGELLELGGALEKDNTGTDLRQLFIGSEGTLGVIVAATLKLAKPAPDTNTMLFAVDGLSGVLALFREARDAPLLLDAFEFFTDRCLDRVQRHRGLQSPLGSAATHYVVMEAEWESDDDAEAWLSGLFERGIVSDGTLAQHKGQAAELWALRESISESLSATGLPHKNDVSLPLAELESFCSALEQALQERYPGWEICLFGHIGDGNLHVNIMKPDDLSREAFFDQTHEADHVMMKLIQEHHGSISAEHGIGLLKKPYLSYSRSPAELAVMRSLKKALDPKGILNPGKILDPA